MLLRAILPAIVALSLPVAAQVSIGGTPTSFFERLQEPVVTETMPPVDVQSLLLEDSLVEGPAPYRFGATIEVDLDAQRNGTWQVLANGDRLWRMRIHSPGALSINLAFSRFWVPSGATLHLYDDDRSRVLGAYTGANVKSHGMFAVQPIAGDAVTLEYREPRDARRSADLSVSHVVHAYRDILGRTPPTEGSGGCNVNANCPVAAPWADQKRASFRLVQLATLCSGSMVNNTNLDGRQIMITANHCNDGTSALWVMEFNYESATCGGANAPNNTSVSGATVRLSNAGSDVCIAEITETIPPSYGVYLAGWNRSGDAPQIGFGFHHPSGDIKKFCLDDDPLTPATFSGAQSWRVERWEEGVTEPGSSGSPIYDEDGLFVGQLYGGSAACGNRVDDYYGRVDTSFSLGAGLFLDPGGTATERLFGMDLPLPTTNPSPYCTAKITSTGSSPSVGSSGTPSFAVNDFAVTCSDALAGKSGLGFFGLQPRQLAFQGGTLCARAPLRRTPIFQFDGSGFHSMPVTISNGDIGATRYYQFWFRDPMHPDGTGIGLSNALRVTLDP